MMLEKSLKTPRMRIRSWRKEDTGFVLSLWGDKENGKYMSDPASENVDERYLECIREMEDNPEGYYLVAELKENGTLVGTCCAFPDGESYDIGYCISKDYWKQGLGTEMLEALILWIKENGGKSITAEAADENLASVSLLHKLGFMACRKTRYKKWGEDTCFEAHCYRLDLG